MQIKKKALVGAIAAVAAAGLAFGVTSPASADPNPARPTEAQERALIAVGSDTTQDVFSGFAASITSGGNPVIASYDATGGGTIKGRQFGNEFNRPNGSGQGVSALRSATDDTTTVLNGSTPVNLNDGDVQIARSSSGAAFVANGKYSYIPFAQDAVTYATAPTSNVPANLPLGVAADDVVTPFTSTAPGTLTLRHIYQGSGYLTDGVVKFYVGTGTPASGWTKLNVYVPQSGSGTRNFWGTTLGFNATALPAGVTDTYPGGSVQEHDGSALVSNPNAIVPFSIAQHIAQGRAASLTSDYGVPVVDRLHGAEIRSIDGIAPTLGSAPTQTLNPVFPVSRPVFNVVERVQLTVNPLLKSVLTGVISGVSDFSVLDAVNPTDLVTPVIEDFGFARLAPGGTLINDVNYVPGDYSSFRVN